MAFFTRGKNLLFSRLKSLTHFQRVNHTLEDAGLQIQFYAEMGSTPHSANCHVGVSQWKKIDARKFGITRDMISRASWAVLSVLRKEGFEAYLVGGCVRDLILNRIPKDFDVITSAGLEQIKKSFRRCWIVGQRFPICIVHARGCVIEVSSFETVARHADGKEKKFSSLLPSYCDEKDILRWRNSMHRDFTVNSLFFDPYLNKIYDYANGVSDIRSLQLRTVIPAHLSFKEDCARILRGLRIAARLGLSFSKDTESAMIELSRSVESLDKFRLMLELNYMLSYGAAQSSFCLLQKFNLLEILLPFHAAYFNEQRVPQDSTMLMKLLFYMDKWVSCGKPADCSLWIGLLLFHLALVKSPQDALVVWTFASVLYHGKWDKGLKFARERAQNVKFVPEISGFSETKSDEDLAEEVSHLASLVQDSVHALTQTDGLFEVMSKYPLAPCSGLVFVSQKAGKNVAQIFGVLLHDIESFDDGKVHHGINYNLIGKGKPSEVRFMLGRIILEAMQGGVIGEGTKGNYDEKDLQSEDNCHEQVSDPVRNQFVDKHDKINGKSLPKAEKVIVKKRTFVDRNCSLSGSISIKEQVVTVNEEFLDMANKHQMGGNISEKKESHVRQELTVKWLETIQNNKYQDGAKKHRKVVDKVKKTKPHWTK